MSATAATVVGYEALMRDTRHLGARAASDVARKIAEVGL